MAEYKRKKIKICVAASAGGHLDQLLKLSDSWTQYESFYVTTKNIVAKRLQQHGLTYIIGECNRQHLLQTCLVFINCLKIIFKEHPDVVISTGAAPGFLICVTAMLTGARIVWIDSIANVQNLSLSGRMIRPFSDLILTQWPELAEKYKNVEYAGAII